MSAKYFTSGRIVYAYYYVEFILRRFPYEFFFFFCFLSIRALSSCTITCPNCRLVLFYTREKLIETFTFVRLAHPIAYVCLMSQSGDTRPLAESRIICPPDVSIRTYWCLSSIYLVFCVSVIKRRNTTPWCHKRYLLSDILANFPPYRSEYAYSIVAFFFFFFLPSCWV